MSSVSKPVFDSAEEVCPVLVGTKIPAVAVKTVDGNEVALHDVIAKKPTVLIFYRGGWCPYCNVQLGQIQEIESKLVDMGYQILAVSADRPEKLRESIKKHKMNYTLLSDNKMTAAKVFGLAFKVDEKTLEQYKQFGINLEDASGETHHILPVPAAFIIGTDGVIKFSYVNPDYKIRVEPDVLLAAAKAALK